MKQCRLNTVKKREKYCGTVHKTNSFLSTRLRDLSDKKQSRLKYDEAYCTPVSVILCKGLYCKFAHVQPSLSVSICRNLTCIFLAKLQCEKSWNLQQANRLSHVTSFYSLSLFPLETDFLLLLFLSFSLSHLQPLPFFLSPVIHLSPCCMLLVLPSSGRCFDVCQVWLKGRGGRGDFSFPPVTGGCGGKHIRMYSKPFRYLDYSLSKKFNVTHQFDLIRLKHIKFNYSA